MGNWSYGVGLGGVCSTYGRLTSINRTLDKTEITREQLREEIAKRFEVSRDYVNRSINLVISCGCLEDKEGIMKVLPRPF